MKCFFCETEARAVCQFCGRFVCKEHVNGRYFHSGYGQKAIVSLSTVGSDTGISVKNAVWCGHCSIEYERTY